MNFRLLKKLLVFTFSLYALITVINIWRFHEPQGYVGMQERTTVYGSINNSKEETYSIKRDHKPLDSRIILLDKVSDDTGSKSNSRQPSYSCNLIYCGGNKTLAVSYNTAQNLAGSNNVTRRFPKAICIGLPKTGTTALLSFLKRHPNIAAFNGEVNFFSYNQLYKQSLDFYLKRMPPSSPDQITFEKSPLYGVTKFGDTVIDRIYQYDPDIKLLFMVRNPIEKVMSAYQNFFVRAGKAGGISFEDYCITKEGKVDEKFYPIVGAKYFTILEPWLNKFKREQIHIVNGDKFIQSPNTELQAIETYLNITSFYKEELFVFDKEKGFFCFKSNYQTRCLGKASGHKPPGIHPEVVQKLKEYFRPHNQAFYNLVGRTFNWDD